MKCPICNRKVKKGTECACGEYSSAYITAEYDKRLVFALVVSVVLWIVIGANLASEIAQKGIWQ